MVSRQKSALHSNSKSRQQKGLFRGFGLFLICLGGIFTSCQSSKSDLEITVYAAASMTDYLLRVAEEFEEHHPWKVRFSFAASSVLARQIEAGAKADLFISANPEWATYLAKQFPKQPSPEPYLGNTMVLIRANGRALPDSFENWSPKNGRIALGNPEHVPAGKYAKRGLEALGLWENAASQVIPMSNVREALQLVLRGECEWGFVYGSDASVANLQGLTLPMPEGNVIQYQLFSLGETSNAGSRAFKKFLFSSYATELAIKMGFAVSDRR